MNRIARFLAPCCAMVLIANVDVAEAGPKLSRLTLDVGNGANVTLTPAFSPTHLAYSVAVASDVYRVNLTASSANGERLSIRGRSLQADSPHAIDLPFAGTAYPVPIEVTGPDLKSVTYQLSVRRQEGCSEPNRIVLANGSLQSEFDAAVAEYRGVVPPGQDSVQLIAFSPCAYSQLSIEGSPERFGQASRPIALNAEEATIEVTTTAEDSAISSTYHITVQRGSVQWQNFAVE